jgi:hypothetical protein
MSAASAPMRRGLRSWRGVAVRPIWMACGLRRSTSDQRPQAERWHSSMMMTEKAFSP